MKRWKTCRIICNSSPLACVGFTPSLCWVAASGAHKNAVAVGRRAETLGGCRQRNFLCVTSLVRDHLSLKVEVTWSDSASEVWRNKAHCYALRLLCRMMVSELERHQYVASTTPIKSSLQRVGDGKRRIDYVLYKQCEQYDLVSACKKIFCGKAARTFCLRLR